MRPRACLRIRTIWVLGLVLSAGNLLAADTNPPAASTLPELQQRLEQVISRPAFDAAFWGVKVVSLDSGKTLFEHYPQKLFSPASNSKLYTVALALDRFGSEGRLRTSLYASARTNRRGTLKGDLVVFGRGDPTFNARMHGGDIFHALEPFVTALTNAGVKRIRGDLVGDTSYFRGPEFGSGWMWDDLEYTYGAEVSALTINDNLAAVRVEPGARFGAPCRLTQPLPIAFLVFSNRTETVAAGSKRNVHFYRLLNENVVYVSGQMAVDDKGYLEEIPVHNPAELFVRLLKAALEKQGIKVRGEIRTMNWLDRQARPLARARLVELGAVESPPMRGLAAEVLKPSQNLYTDLLLANVGESSRDAAADSDKTSEDLGVRELNKMLARAGVNESEAYFEEGSGLSRDNLTSPNATLKLLKYVSAQKYAGDYIAALPVAGVDGTLKNRMKGTPADGNVRAKTGSLRWTSSLSGHVTSAAGERLAFSFMLNRYQAPSNGEPARAALDELAVLLASFSGRSGPSEGRP